MAVRDGNAGEPRGNTLLTFARENIPLIASITGALIFALRCTIVTRGNAYTASILVAETSIGDAVRALLFSALPSVLAIAGIIALFQASQRIAQGKWREPETLGLIMISLGCYLGSYYTALSQAAAAYTSIGQFDPDIVRPDIWDGIFLIASSLWVMTYFHRLMSNAPAISAFYVGKTHWRTKAQIIRWGLVGLMVALLILILRPLGSIFTTDSFWLPRERLTFKGDAPFTGYVLKAKEGYLVILKDNSRIIIEKPIGTLQDRDFCYPKDPSAPSSELAADAPACP